jgi:hypothetical protein
MGVLNNIAAPSFPPELPLCREVIPRNDTVYLP